ncbi:integrase catalytic domain-containing protein [Trichonephila clavipes]|nr:integrase catalytic domain-containing protein [Trichonephila clavipes]
MRFVVIFKGAFLTIGIAEEDRDYLRFLVSNDGDAKSYKIMRMNCVPFGVTLSPFILAATIKFHIRKYKEDYRETYELLNTSLYVDDLFAGSSESVYKAFDLSKDAIEILKDANMNLRKFKTNSKELRKLWNENGIGDVCESGVQVTAPLPALRVEQSAPFSVVGIDFGGPLYTKDENKHYIVLFTCAVTRALHLELVNNLTTETFLLALRRFISRRGLCSKILTENAKTFKKSELELKNLWKIISDPTVKAFYASHKIYWQFMIERAPWWGGFYERLIRTVKLALRKTVGRATLFRDELETLLIEIEGVLNSRPLTYIFSEFNEPESLTPSHMILGRRVNSLPPARLNFNSNLSNRKVLIKRFNYRERLLNMFWTKWSKEYICMLKSAHCVKPTGEIKEFKIDDVVLINDEKFPRHFWKLGKVVDVFPGRDGKIRSFPIMPSREALCILQWNAGGLSQSKRAELVQPLSTHDIDAFTIIEVSEDRTCDLWTNDAFPSSVPGVSRYTPHRRQGCIWWTAEQKICRHTNIMSEEHQGWGIAGGLVNGTPVGKQEKR